MKAVQRPFGREKVPSGEPTICDRPSHLASASDSRIAASSNSRTVERATPVDQTVEDELGHWRNRWNVPDKHSQLARRQGALPLGDGTWLGYRRFPTSNTAENEALRVSEYNFLMFGISYIGPEFFPDY